MARHLVLVVLALTLAACGGGDGRGRIVFRLSTERLSDLGRGLGHYEGFAIVNGIPVSTGKFVVNAATTPAAITSPDGERVYGTTLEATFGPSATGLGQNFPFIEDATGFFVTIEPEGDRDGVPSGNVVMAGMVLDRRASPILPLTQTSAPPRAAPASVTSPPRVDSRLWSPPPEEEPIRRVVFGSWPMPLARCPA